MLQAKIFKWVEQYWTLFFYSAVTITIVLISRNYYISHSEFWSISLSQLFGQWQGESFSLYYKIIFSGLLKLLFFFDLNSTEHHLMARTIFGIIASINLILICSSLSSITGNRLTGVLFSLLLLSLPQFTFQIFRVRADTLAMTFLILYFLLHTRWSIKKTGSLIRFLMSISLLFLALLTTPKSIYGVVVLAIYTLIIQPDIKKIRTQTRFLFYIFLTPIALGVFALAQLINYGMIDNNPVSMALDYHLRSMSTWGDINSWGHLIRLLKTNPMPFIGLSILYIFYIYHWKKMNTHERGVATISLLSLLIILIHPDKWPYFFCHYLPFILMPLALFLYNQQKLIKTKIFFVLCLLNPLITTLPLTNYTSNAEQLRVITKLERFFIDNNIKNYFDSTGLLPRIPSHFWFLGPNDPATRLYTLSNLENNQPDAILFTGKVSLATPEIFITLYEHYYQEGQDIWLLKHFKGHIKNKDNLLSMSSIEVLFGYDVMAVLRY